MSLKITTQLMTQRRFLPLWAAQVLGAFNDNLFRYALVTLAAYQGLTIFGLAPEEMAPLAAAMFTIPIVLFSAAAGQASDRFDRTKIMRIAKFAEIWLMLAAAAGFLLGQPLFLLATLFLMGVQSTFFLPARNSALPSLLDGKELVPANALLSGAVNVAILAGAIGGTMLIAPEWGLTVISIILVICAVLGWWAMRQQTPAPGDNSDLKVKWGLKGIFIETPRIMSFAFKAPEVLRPMLGVAWFWMMAAAVITVLPLLTRNVLGADPNVVAVFQLVFTVGAAIGAMITGALARTGDALRFSLIGAIGLVVFPIDLALYTLGRTPMEGELISAGQFLADPANIRILIGLAGSAISGGLFLVPLQAMVQRRAKAEMRGRLLAASGVLNGLAGTLGPFVLFGLARMQLPLQGTLWFVALGSALAAAFCGWRMWLRKQGEASYPQ